MRELTQTFTIGLAAMFWIAVLKFVFGVRFEVPGLSALVRSI